MRSLGATSIEKPSSGHDKTILRENRSLPRRVADLATMRPMPQGNG